VASANAPRRHQLKFTVMAGPYGVCRFSPHAAIPEWALAGEFFSITSTPQELSIVCDSGRIPAKVLAEHGWSCFKIEGPIPFDITGVLAACIDPLAAAGIGIFAVSTFDTDYVLVKTAHLDRAKSALRAAGHEV
jgi:hypothetical protein